MTLAPFDTPRARALRPFGLAALTGTLVFLSFPNANLFFLAFLALLPLIHAVESVTRLRTAFALGAVAGLVANTGGFYWVIGLLRDFAYLPLWLCVLLMLLLAAQQGLVFAFAAVAARWARTAGLPALVVWPLAWTIVDAFYPMIFKWFYGNSQYLNAPAAQWAEWGGVPLVTFWVVLANVALYAGLRGGDALPGWARTTPLRRAVPVLASLALLHGVGAVLLWTTDARIAAADTLRVGLVEADIGIYEKADPDLFRNNLLLHQSLSRDAEAQGAELIIWPETAYQERRMLFTTEPVSTREEADQRAVLRSGLPPDVTWLPPSRAPLSGNWREDERRYPQREIVPPQRGFSSALLTGTLFTRPLSDAEQELRPERGGRRRTYQMTNSAILLDGDGQVHGTYDKIALMPFSERVPLGPEIQRWFGVNLYDIIPAAGDFFVGTHVRTLPLPRPDAEPAHLGMMICYEDIMPDHGRRLVRENERVDAIINITNDAWFGKTSEPALHMALATFRAIETRTSLVRSTNTGISCVIDPAGRILAQTSLDDAEILVHDLPLLPARHTLFVRWGHLWVWGLVLALVVGVRRARRPPIHEASAQQI